jgi:hypothetical protein
MFSFLSPRRASVRPATVYDESLRHQAFTVDGLPRNKDISWGSKLDVESDDPSFARKMRETRSYQRPASALARSAFS